jgi:hypothetical protein
MIYMGEGEVQYAHSSCIAWATMHIWCVSFVFGFETTLVRLFMGLSTVLSR